MPEYIDLLQSAFIGLWAQVVTFLPQLVFAALIFVIGLIAAGILQSAVERVVRLLKVDELVEKIELKDFLRKAGITLNVAKLLGWLVKWFIIIFALVAAADALRWDQVTDFLNVIVNYVPNVMVAVIILLVGVILANFVQDVVKGALDAAKMQSGHFVAGVARWAIVVFSFMAALVQLGIAQELIQVLFTGFVAMLALAGGLAFGLGGREHASKLIDQLSKDLTKRD